MSVPGSIYVAHARWAVPMVAAWNAPTEEAATMPCAIDGGAYGPECEGCYCTPPPGPAEEPLYCIAWADGTFSVPLPFMVCAIGVLQVAKPAVDIMPAECVDCERPAGMVCCVAAEVAW